MAQSLSLSALFGQRKQGKVIFITSIMLAKDCFTRYASERLPLNYAFAKSISIFIWSDVICVSIRNAKFWQQTENNSEPWHERKCCHMHIRLAVSHSAALKRFNQTTFVALTKSCRNIWCSVSEKLKIIGLHLSTNMKTPHDTSRSHLIWMAWKESSAANIKRYVAIIVMRLLSNHSWHPITILHHLFYEIS